MVVSVGWGEVCFCARVRRGAALDSRSPPSPPAALGPWKSRRCRPVSPVCCAVQCGHGRNTRRMSPRADRRWSMVDGRSSCQPRMFCNLCPGTNTCVPAGTKEPRGTWRPLWTQAVGRSVVTVVICCRHQMSPIGQRRTHYEHGCWLSASRGEGSALLVCSSTVVVLVLVSWKEGKTARPRNTASRDVMPALPARSVMPSVWHRPWSLGLCS